MTHDSVATEATPAATIDAGEFMEWLQQMRAALKGKGGMEVPCGDCVGCCTSNYSILLRPHDVALDVVPTRCQSGLRSLPYPHMQMRPLANGHCPMFVVRELPAQTSTLSNVQSCSGHCSIYAQRPQTCLDYDCRVFTAAGIVAGDRPVINQRVQSWRFSYRDTQSQAWHQAVQAAAQFCTEHAAAFPVDWLPDNPSGLAVLAVKTCALFLQDEFLALTVAQQAARLMSAARAFDRSD